MVSCWKSSLFRVRQSQEWTARKFCGSMLPLQDLRRVHRTSKWSETGHRSSMTEVISTQTSIYLQFWCFTEAKDDIAALLLGFECPQTL